MKHKKVTSSTIQDFEYHPETKSLDITFKSGDTYTYSDVPPERYLDLCSAESHGKAFHASIKGQFPTRKHEPKD